MRVTVDSTRCIACGMCAYAVPEVFRVTGTCSSVVRQPDPAQLRRVQDAANGCPVNAIQTENK